MKKNYYLILVFAMLLAVPLKSVKGQYAINAIGVTQTINFENFEGAGFSPTPNVDQLNSNNWEILGMSDGNLTFGGTETGGDFARGYSTGGIGTGGLHSFNVGSGNGYSIGVQPAGADFTPGSITLRIENNTGAVIDDLELTYSLWVFNDQNRGNTFNFEHSSDNATFTQESSLDFTSVETASASPIWEETVQTILLEEVNIADGDLYYLKWTSDDNLGGGGRDEFALENISITGQAALPNTFYSKSTGNLNNLTTWGADPNGTGVEPIDFTTDDQTFIIQNTTTASIDGNWEVSGIDSKVVLGNGTDAVTFSVPSANSFTGTIDVEANAILELNNALIPTFGMLADVSTVSYNADATAISYADYSNLILNDITPVFNGNDDVIIRGDLILNGSVAMPDARLADEYNFIFNGTGAQTITGNGNVVRAYNHDFIKTNGSISLAVNTTLSTDNQLTFVMDAGTSFDDNSNLIYAGNSVNIGGDESAYNFTGTLILADTEAGIVKGSGDGNNFNIREGNNANIVAALNNITITAPNVGGQFRFRDGTTNNFTIKGDFIIEEQVEGLIRFYDNNVNFQGDFEVAPNFLGDFNAIKKASFNGTTAQSFSNDYQSLEILTLEVNNGNSLNLNTDISVSDSLTLTSGIIEPNTSETVYLGAGGIVSNASTSSYVNGVMHAEVNTDAATNVFFPIGKNGAYRPITLNVNQTNIEDVWYRAEVIDAAAPTFTLDPALDAVSTIRHFEVDQVTSADLDALSITLNYDTDDDVTIPNELRIAHEVGGEWTNLGGVGSGTPNGTITSSNAFTTLGLFTLADADPSSVNDPEIIVTPASLSFFNQELGSSSLEQTVNVQGLFLSDDITITATAPFEISTTSGTGFTNTIVLNQSSGSVPNTEIFIRLNSSSVGAFSESITFESTDAPTETLTTEGETNEVTGPGEDLIYYWHFNSLEAPEDVNEIDADYSLIPNFLPKMVYTGSSNRDIDEYEPGSTINLQMSQLAGKAARVRNESEGRSLLFNLNTSGCSDLVFEYAIHRSGSGMLENIIEYSLDGGSTFSQDDLPQTNFTITESYELVSVDLTDVIGANNNPNFQIKITWQGNTQQTNGNNRYDNITLKGNATNVSTSENTLSDASILMYPNPARSNVNFQSSHKIDFIEIIDLKGKVILHERITSSDNISINIEGLKSGVYLVKLANQNGAKQMRLVKN